MDTERTQARLENALTVEPMLGALRTISLGTWQSATSRLQKAKETSIEYRSMLALLMPALAIADHEDNVSHDENTACGRQLVVLAGTERGLCGKLDQDLIAYVEKSDLAAGALENAEVVVFGGRLSKAVTRQWVTPNKTYSVASTALPVFSDVFELTREWIRRVANGEFSRVLVYFTAFHSATHREPAVIQLLPYTMEEEATSTSDDWPPPILETDPKQLFVRIYEQLAAIQLYEVLLQTKASIHSARFQMMEDSTKNADRLIEDLTIILQTERRQAITREMQELAVGAGLLQR